MIRRPFFLICGAALTVACAGTPLFTPRPDAAVPLGSHDSRRALAGSWRAEFVADSVEWPSGGDSIRFRHGPTNWIVGTLWLGDTVAGLGVVRGLRSDLVADFTPILGRQMSCFQSGRGVIDVERHGQTVQFWFTPGAGDCGFGGTARYYGDSIVGTWSEAAFVGAASVGRFRFVRLPPTR